MHWKRRRRYWRYWRYWFNWCYYCKHKMNQQKYKDFLLAVLHAICCSRTIDLFKSQNPYLIFYYFNIFLFHPFEIVTYIFSLMSLAIFVLNICFHFFGRKTFSKRKTFCFFLFCKISSLLSHFLVFSFIPTSTFLYK